MSQEIRPFSVETNVNRYAEGSALIKMGNTHVLCTASVAESVPGWLEGSDKGWVTAEYSMLPRATHTRSRRDREKVSGRTLEIQRLVARSLRACVDLKALKELSITVDCDVLQADGGTRTASINGGVIALKLALDTLHRRGRLSNSKYWVNSVSAISIGIKDGEVITDLDYDKDSSCDVDMNFVITGTGEFVEVQGTAERRPFTDEQLTKMKEAALQACSKITQKQKEILG